MLTQALHGVQAVAQVAVAKAAFTVEAKNKLKTKKAAAKRFKVTAGGKVMARHAMKGERERPTPSSAWLRTQRCLTRHL